MLEIKGLTKKYKNADKNAIEDINLKLKMVIFMVLLVLMVLESQQP